MINEKFEKLVSKGGEDTVKFSEWKSGKGAMPKKAAQCLDPFEVTINGTKDKIYHNRSKSGVAYFYAINAKGVWCWTRDDVASGTEYITYVKPAPTPKAKEEEEAKN